MKLNASYWDDRYISGTIPWDIGYASPAIKLYFEKVSRDAKILIPGAGKAHEAAWLMKQGFEQVYVCDWAEHALEYFLEMVPDFPRDQLIIGDFFKIEDTFDYIIEQTFFCALDPALRKNYTLKMKDLLRPGGRLVGLLFASVFDRPGPPFGGTKAEYLALFSPHFDIIQMEITDLSIPPRMGNELFFEMKRGD
ncbi:MAG: methyltransferase domain-containing protein [Saprospiraceae bacterium]|nr:methyltransferase domain-containing protein [Saprospiraceae bacterium]